MTDQLRQLLPSALFTSSSSSGDPPLQMPNRTVYVRSTHSKMTILWIRRSTLENAGAEIVITIKQTRIPRLRARSAMRSRRAVLPLSNGQLEARRYFRSCTTISTRVMWSASINSFEPNCTNGEALEPKLFLIFSANSDLERFVFGRIYLEWIGRSHLFSTASCRERQQERDT